MSLSIGAARAQTPEQYLPVVCSTLAVGSEVLSKFGELPIFAGKDDQQNVNNLNVMVFVNKETQTFTVALLSKEQNRFCAVSSGQGIVLPKDEKTY